MQLIPGGQAVLSLRQKRVAFRLVFVLPVALLGIALLLVGAARTVSEMGGTVTPADTLSGPAAMGVSLLPIGIATLLTWVFCRRLQPQPPPSRDAIGPVEGVAKAPPPDLHALAGSAAALGIEINADDREQGVVLCRHDRWHVSALLIIAGLLIAGLVLPPSLSAGSLAITPVNPGLAILGSWLALFALFAALPTATRRVSILPEQDRLAIKQGWRSWDLGLSRLTGLEVRQVAESTRDSEIQSPQSTRHHAALIAWFLVEDRPSVPFLLVVGPRTGSLEQAERQQKDMRCVASALARWLGVNPVVPPGADSDYPPYE